MSAVQMPSTSHTPIAVRARWVLPIDQPPIEGGIVTIAGGRIVAVGENCSGRPPRDLGDVALLPGLVNAHTHLEFSLLDQPLGEPGMPFPAVDRPRGRVSADAGQGPDGRDRRLSAVPPAGGRARDWPNCKRRRPWPWARSPRPAGRGSAFRPRGSPRRFSWSCWASTPASKSQLLAMAKSFVTDVQDAGPALRPGLSPHAPYTVSPDLVRKVCELSAQERFPRRHAPGRIAGRSWNCSHRTAGRWSSCCSRWRPGIRTRCRGASRRCDYLRAAGNRSSRTGDSRQLSDRRRNRSSCRRPSRPDVARLLPADARLFRP